MLNSVQSSSPTSPYQAAASSSAGAYDYQVLQSLPHPIEVNHALTCVAQLTQLTWEETWQLTNAVSHYVSLTAANPYLHGREICMRRCTHNGIPRSFWFRAFPSQQRLELKISHQTPRINKKKHYYGEGNYRHVKRGLKVVLSYEHNALAVKASHIIVARPTDRQPFETEQRPGIQCHQRVFTRLEGKGIAEPLTVSTYLSHKDHRPRYDLHQAFYPSDLLRAARMGSMRLASGESVHMDFDQVKSVILQTLQTLDRLHAIGVVHRDIKAANILLDETASGQIRSVLNDFDLASASFTGLDGSQTPYIFWDLIGHEGIPTPLSDLIGACLTLLTITFPMNELITDGDHSWIKSEHFLQELFDAHFPSYHPRLEEAGLSHHFPKSSSLFKETVLTCIDNLLENEQLAVHQMEALREIASDIREKMAVARICRNVVQAEDKLAKILRTAIVCGLLKWTPEDFDRIRKQDDAASLFAGPLGFRLTDLFTQRLQSFSSNEGVPLIQYVQTTTGVQPNNHRGFLRECLRLHDQRIPFHSDTREFYSTLIELKAYLRVCEAYLANIDTETEILPELYHDLASNEEEKRVKGFTQLYWHGIPSAAHVYDQLSGIGDDSEAASSATAASSSSAV